MGALNTRHILWCICHRDTRIDGVANFSTHYNFRLKGAVLKLLNYTLTNAHLTVLESCDVSNIFTNWQHCITVLAKQSHVLQRLNVK